MSGPVGPLHAEARKALSEATECYERDQDAALDYLHGRGLEGALVARMRLGRVCSPLPGHEGYAGRLAIPSLGWDGQPYALRFRCIEDHECKAEGHPKYVGLSSTSVRLFNLRSVHEAGDDICITEGEIDALSLEQCGLRAVGVPGANLWKAHHPRMFSGFARVWVFGDGDAAGAAFARTVCDSLVAASSVPVPEGMDVNSVLVEHGGQAVLDLIRR